MRAIAFVSFACFAAACKPSPPPAKPVPPVAKQPEGPSHDFALYKDDYVVPADWPDAKDDAGQPIREAHIAKQVGDRRIMVSDSVSSLFGHDGQLKKTVVAVGSHCGLNVSQLIVKVHPLGAIGNDAGIGLHSAGVQCISICEQAGIPAATVSSNTAYIGVGLSLWTTGKISRVNAVAESIGVRVGMTTQEALDIMAAKAPAVP